MITTPRTCFTCKSGKSTLGVLTISDRWWLCGLLQESEAKDNKRIGSNHKSIAHDRVLRVCRYRRYFEHSSILSLLLKDAALEIARQGCNAWQVAVSIRKPDESDYFKSWKQLRHDWGSKSLDGLSFKRVSQTVRYTALCLHPAAPLKYQPHLGRRQHLHPCWITDKNSGSTQAVGASQESRNMPKCADFVIFVGWLKDLMISPQDYSGLESIPQSTSMPW